MSHMLSSYVVAASLATAPAVPQATTPPAAAPAVASPAADEAAVGPDLQLQTQYRRAVSTTIAGVVTGCVGLVTLGTVTLQAHRRYISVRGDAKVAEWVTDRDALRRRGLRLRRAVRGSAGVGIGLFAAGGAIFVVGMAWQAALRRRPSRVTVAPAVLPRGGAVSAAVRF